MKMQLAEKRELDKALYLRWVCEMQKVQFRDVTSKELDALSIRKAVTFYEFARFITYFASHYGSYGINLYPTQVKVSEDYEHASPSAISRWLKAAVLLGWLEQTGVPDSRKGLTGAYQIGQFWDRWVPPRDPWGPIPASTSVPS